MTDAPDLVVVVDDDASVRSAIDRLLRSAGYAVRTLASAKEFLEYDDRDRASCVILDVRMPGQSGLDLQSILVAARDDVPIVFITGHADLAMAVQAMRAGAVDFLAKPFEDDELLEAVGRAAAMRRQGRRGECCNPSPA